MSEYVNYNEKENLDKFSMRKNLFNEGLLKEFEEKDKEIERLKTKLEKIQDIILCYGETFDSKVHQEMQEKILDILEIKIGQAKLGGDK